MSEDSHGNARCKVDREAFADLVVRSCRVSVDRRFDWSPDLPIDLRDQKIDSLVIQGTFRMGYEGVKAAVKAIAKRPTPKRLNLAALLITVSNLESPEIRKRANPNLSKYLN